jgi:hypothetical protein
MVVVIVVVVVVVVVVIVTGKIVAEAGVVVVVVGAEVVVAGEIVVTVVGEVALAMAVVVLVATVLTDGSIQSKCYVHCLLLQTTMEFISALLFLALLVAAALFLLPQSTARARIVSLVNRLPGPPSYPLIGSLLPFALLHRRGT